MGQQSFRSQQLDIPNQNVRDKSQVISTPPQRRRASTLNSPIEKITQERFVSAGVSIIERKGKKVEEYEVLDPAKVYKTLPTNVILNILHFHPVFMELVPIEGPLLDMAVREFMGLFPDGKVVSLCFNVLVRNDYPEMWSSSNIPILLIHARTITVTYELISSPSFSNRLFHLMNQRVELPKEFIITESIKWQSFSKLDSEKIMQLLTHVNVQLSENTPHNALDILSNFARLKSVIIDFSTNLDTEDWFLESLYSLTHVKEVSLCYGKFSTTAFTRFMKTAPFSKICLRKLRVGGSNELCFKGIEENDRLRLLSFIECGWQNEYPPFECKTIQQLLIDMPPRIKQTSLTDVRKSLETRISPCYSVNYVKIVGHDAASIYNCLFLLKSVKTMQLNIKSFVSIGSISVLLNHITIDSLILGSRMGLNRDSVFKICEEKNTRLFVSGQF